MTRNVEQERIDKIVNEVMDLIGAPDVFGFLDESFGNMQAVENRLQEVMSGRWTFSTFEIATYLRTCCLRRDSLPTWQPLLNAAVEMGRMRGEFIDDMFYGLMPSGNTANRNTDGYS